ncbi:hypothetical protein VFPBJ_01129 [Purpureocillium lilacinum]|uniref:Uncharacterized protein n=1 Tax=Purpureocillium lilacinum TaxID=33203 RepID=A0A179HCA4_PURLI|nr:hypothetical protein VFPBJ_01129 [Purpureocillium lilacinum]
MCDLRRRERGAVDGSAREGGHHTLCGHHVGWFANIAVKRNKRQLSRPKTWDVENSRLPTMAENFVSQFKDPHTRTLPQRVGSSWSRAGVCGASGTQSLCGSPR